ncbi:sigma factor [Porphyromonas macacae]|uniref:sigma factor n=1 Tax=Porphyromonas macacae TaxID=28115 RepID=UPI0012DE2C47|nr:sigma factor [Porphyromonas macacae]
MKQNSFINQVTVLRPELERIAAQMYEGDAERAEDAVSELLIKLCRCVTTWPK